MSRADHLAVIATERTERAPSARERAYGHVRDAILRGVYPPGAFIEEDAVCRATGVSRTPVREAFHKLESERFLDLLPRRGAQVRRVTAREMLEVYETRRLVEGFAIDRICDSEDAAPAALRDIAGAMRALPPGEIVRHAELDHLFHRTLVAGSGNGVMIELYDSLRARQQSVAIAALRADPDRVGTILDEHDEIVAALAARQARPARRTLDAHLRPIGHVIRKLT